MAKPRFPKALSEHVGREFAASQQYVAIAVYYDNETLPNLAAHFYRQAVEERNHAMMMVQYLLDAGHEVVIPGVEAPKTAFSDAVAPVSLALEQERTVTRQISELAALARGEARPDSDIDFLVELEKGRSLLDLGGLLMDLQELLHCKVDVVTEKGLRARIRDRVLQEAVPL
jgi:ferritin